jgi:hypothetical protein
VTRRKAPEPTESWLDLPCECSTSELHAIVNVRCVSHGHLVPYEDRLYMLTPGRSYGRLYGPIDRPLWRPRRAAEGG